MNKAEFELAVRQNLKEVPLETRREWDGNKLFEWWMKTSDEHLYLTWDRGRGDPWQYVHGMCMNLIGERAMM